MNEEQKLSEKEEKLKKKLEQLEIMERESVKRKRP